jgi:hypothetical protein
MKKRRIRIDFSLVVTFNEHASRVFSLALGAVHAAPKHSCQPRHLNLPNGQDARPTVPAIQHKMRCKAERLLPAWQGLQVAGLQVAGLQVPGLQVLRQPCIATTHGENSSHNAQLLKISHCISQLHSSLVAVFG